MATTTGADPNTAGRATSHHPPTRIQASTRRRELGQATAEYALVLLGAAAVALMLAAWASESGAIPRLFNAVVDQLIGRAG